MITAERTDHRITRNVSYFKYIDDTNPAVYNDDEETDYSDIELVGANVPENASEDNPRRNETIENDGDENDGDESETDEEPLRRSARVTGQPVRSPMDVAI